MLPLLGKEGLGRVCCGLSDATPHQPLPVKGEATTEVFFATWRFCVKH